MNTALKKIVGWNRRTEEQKAALRRLRFMHCHLLRPLGSQLSSFGLAPEWLKRNVAIAYVQKAMSDQRLGASSTAKMAARRAVSLFPNVPSGYETLSGILLPGAGYYDLLTRFHEWLRPKNYIEIGVNKGGSIVLAKPPTIAVGIDPEPRLAGAPRTVCKIFPMTSDDYFATRDPRRDIEADSVDLAFIDGLHLFEQALRDFINIERVSSAATIVLIHDCFPIDSITSNRERKTIFWSGDVWKIIPCLREFRPDLNVFTVATAPTGMGVVSGLDSRSTILIDHFDEILSRYKSLQIDHDESLRKNRTGIIANDWQEIISQLSR
jgi:hypothetical protein